MATKLNVMKSLFEKINVLGFALILVCAVIFTTQSAFKGVQKMTPPADGWYEITITDSSLPEVASKQQISSSTPQDAPPVTSEEACAQTLNAGHKCSVFLDFESTATSIPATVADVDNVNVSITGTARLPL